MSAEITRTAYEPTCQTTTIAAGHAVAGNHDMCMFGADKVEGLPENVHYLCNSGIDIDGIKFYDMPMFMEYVMDNFVR